MKKRKAEKKTLKRCLVWVMTAVIAFTPSITGFGTLTAYAVEDYGYGDHVNPSDEKYTNQETSGAESVKEMNDKVDIAKEAVKDAEEKVVEVEKAVDEANKQAGIAADAAQEAQDAAGTPSTETEAGTGAAGAAEEAKSIVNGLPDADEVMNQIDGEGGYNDRVADTQKKIDEITDLETVKDGEGNTIVGQIVDDSGNSVDVTLEEYADAQAQAAAQAAAEAKAKLEEALAVNTDQVTEEVKDIVEEVKGAAEEAKKAADNAQAAYNTAQSQKDKAIEEYNKAAMTYGLPLYGEDTVTYGIEDLIAAGLVNEAGPDGNQEKLQEDLDKINQTDLTAQQTMIDKAEQEVGAAADKFTAAQTAAEEAKKAAEDATELIKTDKETAEKAAEDVNDYYVAPAKEALDKTLEEFGKKNEEVVDLSKKKDEADTTHSAAVNEAKEDGEAAFNAEVERLEKALQDAQKALDEAKWYEWATLSIKRDEAKRALNKYNTDKKKNEIVNDSIHNSEAVKEAQKQLAQADAAYQAACSELTELNKKKAAEQAAFDAAQNVKNEYLNEISTAYQSDLQDELVEDIKTILGEYSDDINQLEFDKDLNDWANKLFNSWDLIDKYRVRDLMDDKYQQSFIDSIFNKFGLTQWMIPTGKTEQIINKLESAYVDQLQIYEEKMATAEVNFAAMDADKIYQEAVQKAQAAAEAVSEIGGFGEQLAEAQTNLQEAQNTYQTAADKLDEMKDKIKDAQFDSLDLSALLDRIRSAEAALKAAEDELKEAKAASAAADNYYNWANALITKQYTNAYVQAVVDEMGEKIPNTSNDLEFDLSNDGVISRPTEHFLGIGTSIEVPYSIYRAYVEAMYDKYNYENVKNGTGISTGSSMEVLFWEVDENGKLTGSYFTEDSILEEGRYFIGYAFKQEDDGYHIDGIMYDYVPETPEEPETPDGPVTPPTTDTTGGTPATTTIDDAPVALAAAPADAAVLGATREADEAVLGATRDSDNAVLGKRRRPGTGDSAALTVWTALLVIAAGGTAAFAAILAKKKRETEEQ